MAETKRQFLAIMNDLGELYERQISPGLVRLYWEDLGHLPIEAFEQLVRAHRRDPVRGRFFPKPADLLAAAEAIGGGALSADEAWTLALEVFDESASVCATEEVLTAAAAASGVWATGDKIGARMAFRAAYDRAITSQRAEGRPTVWRLSLGWDPELRARAAQAAVERKLITQEQAAPHLPPPEPEGPAAAVAGLLTGSSTVVPFPGGDEAKTRRRLAELREAITSAGRRAEPEGPSRTETIAARKRAALAALEAHRNQHAKEAG
ncbi:hypothetical protein MARPU_05655 [Marichromatium purpuratum 984]|uniref:Replicative helicase inhibitor G39P N-terminal domain-containing protein n=1 Tax=Marichromatium purpuratum 984 TaxID=765910 RepID=W0E2U8_MARPU|nr:hypothetical protein MARPU_05655 [Marichromatium purpuratum 984]